MSKTIKRDSIGFGSLLTLLFIALKLTGYITWSWLWVLCPLWFPLAFILSIMLILLITAGIVNLFTKFL